MMRKLQGAGMGNFKMYKREDMQKMAKDMEQVRGGEDGYGGGTAAETAAEPEEG